MVRITSFLKRGVFVFSFALEIVHWQYSCAEFLRHRPGINYYIVMFIRHSSEYYFLDIALRAGVNPSKLPHLALTALFTKAGPGATSAQHRHIARSRMVHRALQRCSILDQLSSCSGKVYTVTESIYIGLLYVRRHQTPANCNTII